MPQTAPEFATELSHEHASLLEQLRGLQETLDRPAAGPGETIADRLRAVQGTLQRHFRFEEQDGYMNHVLEQAAHLHRTVASLLAEHGSLGQQLDELVAKAGSVGRAGPAFEAFREQVRQWIARVRHHEAQENELVQRACTQDLAAED